MAKFYEMIKCVYVASTLQKWPNFWNWPWNCQSGNPVPLFAARKLFLKP